jgi:hypothetical protein
MSESFHLDDDAPLRRVLYLCGVLLLIVPFLQASATPGFLPLQLSNIPWRFGAANALSSVLLLPFLGLSLMLFVARTVQSRAVTLSVGATSALFTLGLIGSVLLFVMDGLQLKKIVNSGQSAAFNMAFVRIGLITSLFIIVFALLTFAAFRTPKRTARPAVKKNVKVADEGVGLIVGREYASPE